MRTTTISSKGQVTLPAAMLREKQLTTGTTLLVVPLADGFALVRRPESISDAIGGSLAYDAYGEAEEHVGRERDGWT